MIAHVPSRQARFHREALGPVAAVGAAADGAVRPPRIAGHGYLPAGGAAHAGRARCVARARPAHAQPLHGGAWPRPGALRPAVGPYRAPARAHRRRAALCGGGLRPRRDRQRPCLRRLAHRAGPCSLGGSGRDLRHGARRLCRPAGRHHHLWSVQRDARLRASASRPSRAGRRRALPRRGFRRERRGRSCAVARSGPIRSASRPRWAPFSCSSRSRRAS